MVNEMFLGVDGGQSHTEAIVADEAGNILGRGIAGPSTPGIEKCETSIRQAIEGAVQGVVFPKFKAACFGMTGDGFGVKESVEKIVVADNISVIHDAPTALMGALSGRPGVVVIAGTGSVVFGRNDRNETARAGGLGYMFSDQGSGIWFSVCLIKRAIKEYDGVEGTSGLVGEVCDFFGVDNIEEVTSGYYHGSISRDRLASFAKRGVELAENGHQVAATLISEGVGALVNDIEAVRKKLGLDVFEISGVGGMFAGEHYKKTFLRTLGLLIPRSVFTSAEFGPGVGALLNAYKTSGVEIDDKLLENLRNSQQ